MFETPAGQEYRDLTFNDSIERLKLRASVLGTITNFVLALSHQKDFPKFKECIENARCAYDAVSQCKKDVNQRVVKFGDVRRILLCNVLFVPYCTFQMFSFVSGIYLVRGLQLLLNIRKVACSTASIWRFVFHWLLEL